MDIANTDVFRQAVRRAVRQYNERITDLYNDKVDELACQYGVSEEEVDRIWGEETQHDT